MSLTTPTQSVGLLPQPSMMSPASGVSPLQPVNPVLPASPVTPGLMTTPPSSIGMSPLTSMSLAPSSLAGPVRPVLSTGLGVGNTTTTIPVGPVGPVGGGPLLGVPPPSTMHMMTSTNPPLLHQPTSLMMSSQPRPPPLFHHQQPSLHTPPLLAHPHTSQVMYIQQQPSQYVSTQPMLQQTTPILNFAQQQPMMSVLPAQPPPSLVQVPIPTAASVPLVQPTMSVLPTATMQHRMGGVIPVAQPGPQPVLLPTPVGGGMIQSATPTYMQGGGVAPQQYVLIQRP